MALIFLLITFIGTPNSLYGGFWGWLTNPFGLRKTGKEATEKISEDMKNAPEEMQEESLKGSGNIFKAANVLSKALEGMDITGVRTLLKENESLREDLAIITDQYTRVSGEVVSNISKDTKVRICVEQYKGSHRVTTWIDDPGNWNWKNRRFNPKDIDLGIDYKNLFIESFARGSLAYNNLILAIQNKASASTINKYRDRFHETTSSHLKMRIDEKINEFLENGALISEPDEQAIDIQSKFMSVGDHTIFILVTPERADRNGRWGLRGSFITIDSNGYQEKFMEFDVDSDMDEYKNHILGKSLKPIKATICIR